MRGSTREDGEEERGRGVVWKKFWLGVGETEGRVPSTAFGKLFLPWRRNCDDMHMQCEC